MELMHGLKQGETTVFLPVAVDGDGRLVVVVEGGVGSGGIVADNGVALPIDSLAKSVIYNAAGTEAYVEVEFDGAVYQKTITYSAGRLSGETGWMVQ